MKDKCRGKITRHRTTKKNREESIIDFVLGCEVMSEMIEGMSIDETKKHALASFRKTKNGTKVKESDHNSMITKVKGLWNKKLPHNRTEMYNLKDKEGLIKFKEMTSKDNFLSSVFNDHTSIEIQTKKFLKRFGYCLSQCFQKVRIN